MAAIAGVVTGPPFLLSNAVGRAVIAEEVRFPAGTAADTLAYTSPNIAKILAIIGNVSYSAPVEAETGATTTMKIADTIPATEFMSVLVIGHARRVHSGGL